jgi:hypothetical protein
VPKTGHIGREADHCPEEGRAVAEGLGNVLVTLVGRISSETARQAATQLRPLARAMAGGGAFDDYMDRLIRHVS